jgi:hypothetical protein
MCALATNGQRAAMSKSAVAPDIHQPFDIHLDAFPQVAFDLALRFENRPNAAQLVVIQVLDAGIEVDCGLIKNRACARTTDTVNVSQPNLGSFIRWKIDACYTCHLMNTLQLSLNQSQIEKRLALPLLMFGVDANHPHHTFAVNDFALVAHFFYRSPDFHVINPQSSFLLWTTFTCNGK